jgi:hypothetical protein
MDADLAFEEVFEIERELRDIEATLDAQRRREREALTEAFREANAETLYDAAERTYPLTTPEKEAVRRSSVGPATLFPEREADYRDLEADQRRARERLADFHRDVFAELGTDRSYEQTLTATPDRLDEPYLTVRVRNGDDVLVLRVDNPTSEGYVYHGADAYPPADVANALRLFETVDEIDVNRIGFLTYDNALLDHGSLDGIEPDEERIRAALRVEILDALDRLDYEYVEREDSPVLTYVETVAEHGLAD